MAHAADDEIRAAAADEIKLIGHSNLVLLVAGLGCRLTRWPSSVMCRAARSQWNPASSPMLHPSNNLGLNLVHRRSVDAGHLHQRKPARHLFARYNHGSDNSSPFCSHGSGGRTTFWRVLPTLSARANLGFYLLFATASLTLWLLAIAVFDRLTYWRIRPGQIVEQRLVGGGEHSYDTHGLVFDRRDQDFFRHIVLGLGAGDLLLTVSGARKETISIPNVLFVDSKLKAIQQLDRCQTRPRPGSHCRRLVNQNYRR